MKTSKNSRTTTPEGTQPKPELTVPDSKRGSVYEQITERIIAMLEKGSIPWQKNWKTQSSWPCNLVSKRPYQGINVFLLHAMSYESPFWLTYRQAQELGGNVRKGEKACPVIFCKRFEVVNEKTEEVERVPMLRFYYVFNTSQCEGLKNIPAPVESPLSAPTKPDEIVAFMPNRPEIKHGLRAAFYSPKEDIVGMPDKARFDSEAAYYGTLYHELCHASGHPSRLNRPTLTESQGFGSDPYSKEELIAEMGAAFLCGQAGIVESTVENSAAYIQGWLRKLHEDKKLLVQAASQAQKAANFILGIQHEEAPTEQKEPATA
jgi:antirestriction protein ArdC